MLPGRLSCTSRSRRMGDMPGLSTVPIPQFVHFETRPPRFQAQFEALGLKVLGLTHPAIVSFSSCIWAAAQIVLSRKIFSCLRTATPQDSSMHSVSAAPAGLRYDLAMSRSPPLPVNGPLLVHKRLSCLLTSLLSPPLLSENDSCGQVDKFQNGGYAVQAMQGS